MSEFDLVVRGGTIVTASDRFRADLGIRDGRIVQIGHDLSGAREVLDATGRLVLPGGVDAHVHLAQPTSDGTIMADDFDSGTRAAAAGGSTTVLPFALQEKGKSLREAVRDYHAKAEGNCHVDVAFHLIVSDPTPQVLGQELPALIRDGYSSFKVFMTYDDLRLTDAELLDVFEVARREKALVMVHAEGHDAIRHITRKLEAAGQTAPYYHAIAHSEIAEREATHRAISHAQLVDVPIVIVHVSGRDPMEQIQWARKRGLRVHAETCPQYIALTRDDLKGLNMDFEGAKYVCSPPPRDTAAQEAIWEGLRDGTFDLFSSDHAPFRYQGEAGTGKDNPRARTSFKWVPNGIPGIETRLPILFSEGVSKGRISIERFVELTATNPAKLYGLYPRKGSIVVGGDADLVLWDPEEARTITQGDLHHGSDYTPYEGMQVTGWPQVVVLKGQVVVRNGVVDTDARRGGHIDRTAI
ncbi:dihydropyrimidinase [Aestuariicoccus sp. MJ-SS9]|uniref:dihydropyrimidinase n=1 Tax=Aestuariicoccus sp. MJ-SS9 TaxID=3079855 RepID=UPI0029099DB0|nr:dihydropyrimidinase [Aestuariicoccus sp. MJ-SS9]MDU8911649.1 dihydropyrimidinase [Aestuariicoccus sp. MJ-SS9]